MAFSYLLSAERIETHPYWPGSKSGITIGIGWDIGVHKRKDLEVWNALGPAKVRRLEVVTNITGEKAHAKLSSVADLEIPRNVSIAVAKSNIGTTLNSAEHLFPGATTLPAEVQVALISLIFNRGTDVGHEPNWKTAHEVDRRWEIRHFANSVKEADFYGIYIRLSTMERLWGQRGTRGLIVRRREEQHMLRPFVDEQFAWEENPSSLKARIPRCG